MTSKVLELTEKIYKEGVEKAKIEAKKILSDAKNKASEIITEANNKGKAIIEQTKKDAAEIKRNSESEMQLSTKQAISSLKQRITELVLSKQVEVPVKEAFKDSEFIKNIILTLIKNWNPQKPEELNLNLLLPQNQEKEFKQFFENKTKQHLNSGLEINFNTNIKSGFKIGPKNGSYIISFSDDDFKNYFKNYLKSSTKQLLFETSKNNTVNNQS